MNGIKARGSKELNKYLTGGRLTQRQMILAKCYDCMGGYADGKMDCGIPECPLYPLMPYKNTPFRSPDVGKVAPGRKIINDNPKMPMECSHLPQDRLEAGKLKGETG